MVALAVVPKAYINFDVINRLPCLIILDFTLLPVYVTYHMPRENIFEIKIIL